MTISQINKRQKWKDNITIQLGYRIDYLLGSYAIENIKDVVRKQPKGTLSWSLYR